MANRSSTMTTSGNTGTLQRGEGIAGATSLRIGPNCLVFKDGQHWTLDLNGQHVTIDDPVALVDLLIANGVTPSSGGGAVFSGGTGNLPP